MKIGEIEKGVKMPEKYFNYKKYPWKDFEVGDSLEIQFSKEELKDRKKFDSKRSGIINQFRKFSKRNKDGKWKFATRGTEKGFRIWRTE